MKKALLLLLASLAIGCSSDENTLLNVLDDESAVSSAAVYALMTDYSSNSMSLVTEVDSLLTVTSNAINVSNDPRGFKFDEDYYIFSRTFTTASIIKITNGAVALEKALPLTNPHDLSDNGTSLYATMYDNSVIYEISKTDLTVIDSIIIPMPADSSNPAPSGSCIVHGKLYVAQQFMGAMYSATRNGQLLVIDVATNTITDSINLPLMNPYSDVVVSADSSMLYVSCAGTFLGDGGVVKVDITNATATTLADVTTNPGASLDIDVSGNLYIQAGYYGSYALLKYDMATATVSTLNVTQIKGVDAFCIKDGKLFVGYSSYNWDTYSPYEPELSVLSLDGGVIASDSLLTIPVYGFVK